MGARIVITGASGNVGTALVRALVADSDVEAVVGIARRLPHWQPAKTRWVAADIAYDDLRPHFAGADAVVNLAWLIQPSRDESITDVVNVGGSRRVFDAVVDAGVPALIHASSVAAYSPARLDDPVDESWPTGGVPSAYYSRQKVAVERMLDEVEVAHPGLRVARARPGLIFQRAAASQIRRLFGGPFVPGWAARRSLIPLVPRLRGLGGQVVHSDDVGQLYRLLALDPDARGAYNVASNPPLDVQALGRLLGARPVGVSSAVARAAVDLSWRARLHPVSAGWLDIAQQVPVMLTDRARSELGWSPTQDPTDVILELMAGLRSGAGFDTPPLAPHAGGPFRIGELRSGVGGPTGIDRRSARGAAGVAAS